MDPDEEPESEDEDDEDEETQEGDERAADEKKWKMLVAEQRLCELGSRMVMAILAGTLDGKGSGGKNIVRKRLERNKARLGHDWKEVVGHLDVAKRAKGKGKPGRKKKDNEPADKFKSTEIIVGDDDDPIEDDEADQNPDLDMRDENEDQANGDADENGVQASDQERDVDLASPEPESVLGD